MSLTLLVICVSASTILGVVHQFTMEPKQKAELLKQTFAIQKVLPEFDNQPFDEKFKIPSADGGDSLVCYIGKKQNEMVGVAVQTWTTKGFGGDVRLMVGFDATGNIYNISVLEQKETPGLGTKMTTDLFKDQFKGMNPGVKVLKVKKDGGEVDAITAATISSRAFCDAVQRAYNSYYHDESSSSAEDGVSGASSTWQE